MILVRKLLLQPQLIVDSEHLAFSRTAESTHIQMEQDGLDFHKGVPGENALQTTHHFIVRDSVEMMCVPWLCTLEAERAVLLLKCSPELVRESRLSSSTQPGLIAALVLLFGY